MKALFGLPINGLDHFEAERADRDWNGFPVPLVSHDYAIQIAEAIGDPIPAWYEGDQPYDGVQWQIIETACPWCGSHTAPVPNRQEHAEDRQTSIFGRTTTWHQRNPLECPDCNGVGGYEDWGAL